MFPEPSGTYSNDLIILEPTDIPFTIIQDKEAENSDI